MDGALQTPRMTREQFLDWVERQEAPHEFDGVEPVAMTGGNRMHARLCRNLVRALGNRLEGSQFEVLPEAGVATVAGAVRYPDVLITGTPGPGTDRLMPGVLVVFEVISPTSGRSDRYVKLREYQAVPTIRRYVIVDNAGPDLAVFARVAADEGWTATTLTAGEMLSIPEAGIDVPVDEIFADVALS